MDKMFFRCKRYPSQLNIVAYKDHKRNLNKKLRNAKKSHFNSKLDESKSNNNKYWEIIRELTKGTTGLQYPPYFNEGGQVIKEDLNIANKFNDYFINIALNKAAPGWDGLTHCIFMLISDYLEFPLQHIINLSFIEGLVPSVLFIDHNTWKTH